jgi:hypothetical protein
MRREVMLELAGQIMRHHGHSGAYGAEVFLPWDGKSEPPESDAECILRIGGKAHSLRLGDVAEIFKVAQQGIQATEQLGPRQNFTLRFAELSRQEVCNLICDLRDLGLLRPIEERPGSAGSNAAD